MRPRLIVLGITLILFAVVCVQPITTEQEMYAEVSPISIRREVEDRILKGVSFYDATKEVTELVEKSYLEYMKKLEFCEVCHKFIEE